MTSLDSVLVIGRPNVGKSTFINKVIGKKIAIVHDKPGVTRDLAYFKTVWNGKYFNLIDSGGVLFEKADDIYLQNKIEALVEKAMEKAHKIIFITDYQNGINPIDFTVANFLRKYKQKVILAVNKIDNPENRFDTAEFLRLGFDKIMPITALHGTGIGDLLDLVVEDINDKKSSEQNEKKYRVAIVGRPNVGKSTLINTILNEDRVITDSKAHTTRDSIEVYFKHKDIIYYFIDTAGMRKKAKVANGIEYYSVLRTKNSILSADLVIIMLEPEPFLTEQDKKILDLVQESGKCMIILVNKWDLTDRTDEIRKNLESIAKSELPYLQHYPFIFGSALNKIHIGKIFDMIPKILANSRKRITTSEFNDFVKNILAINPPPAKKGRQIKIYYATQAESVPPKFIFFINHPKLIDNTYIRFIENRIRKIFPRFFGSPISIFLKKHR